MNISGFIGSYEKKDLLLAVGKTLTELYQKVLIVDATMMQTMRYVVPNVSGGRSYTYISDYLGIDVAVGFMNLNQIMQYLGVTELPYDFIIVDSDNFQTTLSFGIPEMQKIFLTTSYDQAELKRTLENIQRINRPIVATRVAFTSDLEANQIEYFNNLIRNYPIQLTDYTVDFVDITEDRKVTLENQLLNEIRFKHYSDTFKGSLEYLVALIAEGIIEQSKIKNIIKKI